MTDSNSPQFGIFTFQNEEHTLGGLLRTELLNDPSVLFAAYTVEKSTSPSPVLKIQLKTEEPKTAKNALLEAVDRCINTFEGLKK